MIQLANDPQASRAGWRPAPTRAQAAQARSPRAANNWPFLSRHGERPQAPAKPGPSAQDSGS